MWASRTLCSVNNKTWALLPKSGYWSLFDMIFRSLSYRRDLEKIYWRESTSSLSKSKFCNWRQGIKTPRSRRILLRQSFDPWNHNWIFPLITSSVLGAPYFHFFRSMHQLLIKKWNISLMFKISLTKMVLEPGSFYQYGIWKLPRHWHILRESKSICVLRKN